MFSNFDLTLPPAGEYSRLVFPAIRNMPVWLYRPQQVRVQNRIIVAVHGISRDSLQQVRAYKNLADRYGCWLMAPEFGAELFPGYQQLSKGATSARADLALNQMLMLWRQMQGVSNLKMHLCGYSGGAQFCHRYAMLHPGLVESLVVASAGWYSFPDPSVRYPRGVGKWPVWLGRQRLHEMLRLPVLILVGEEDVTRNQSLRQTKRLDLQQGLSRVERAQRWFECIKREKMKLAQAAPVELRLLHGQSHNFDQNVQQGDMLSCINKFWQQREWSNG